MNDEKHPIHQPREFRHGSGSRMPETGGGSGSVDGPMHGHCPTCGSDDPAIPLLIEGIGRWKRHKIVCPDPFHIGALYPD